MLNDHRRAEELSSQASAAASEGLDAEASELYRQAADYEERALRQVSADQTRTRAVLSVSYVSMLYKAGLLDLAGRTCHRMLAEPDGSPWLVGELRALLDVIEDELAIRDQVGRTYSSAALTFSMRGGEIGSGSGPLDLILEKGAGLRSLLYRTAEFLGEFPFRIRGAIPRELVDLLEVRIGQPAIGSYRFNVRFTAPLQYDALSEPPVEPSQVTDTLFRFISSLNEGRSSDLVQLVPDDLYRSALLQLVRNLSPSGRRLGEIGLYRGSGSHVERVYLTKATLTQAREALPREEDATAPWTTIRGVLRAVHLDHNWLEIAVSEDDHRRCQTRPEMLDDVVGPMVNQVVEVRGPMRRAAGGVDRLHVEDIELADG